MATGWLQPLSFAWYCFEPRVMAVCSWQVSLVFLLAMVLRVGWFCCGTWMVSDIFLPVFVLSVGWFGKDYRAVIILFLTKGQKE